MLISALVSFLPGYSRAQFFWLGFQVGEGVTWFSDPGENHARLSPGAGTTFGAFIQYGTRPYYKGGVEWLFSTNQMKFEDKPGSAAHDNVPFHNFMLPLTVGYEVVHRPRFKWRVGGGAFIGANFLVSSNSFHFTGQDIRNPQFGFLGESGIQYLNFLIQLEYDYSLNRFFSKGADTYGYNVRSHLQIFALKAGMQF